MKSIRVMHFADAHFGIETYGQIDPETGLNTRLLDFRRSLNLAIDKALEAGVQLALFAGDAYKSRDPNQTHQREFASCIRKLTENGIPVVMVTGNHDLPNARGRANAIEIYRTLGVERTYVISRPEVLTIETSAGSVQVAGMPYLLRSNVLSREETKGLTVQETTDLMVRRYGEYIAWLASQIDPHLPSVLLGHFWISNAKVSSQSGYLNVSEPQVLLGTAANPAFDYVAMGHIHRFQDLNKRASPPVVYSGSIDRTDFSEKDEDKGFVLVDLAKDSTTYEHVAVPVRRFVDIEVDADVEEPTEKILSAIAESDIENAVVKVLYRVSQENSALVRESDIRDALRPAFMLVSLTRDLRRNARAVRNRLLNEALSPIQALELYFDTREDLKKRKSELMSYALPIIEELLKEEQVA